nr:hypothetical protein [Streptomyces inhibens]
MTCRSFNLASLPVTELNAWPVQENTSNRTSGRSTHGSIAFTAARRSSSDAVSGSGSRAAKCSRPSSSKTICALSGRRPATSR